MADPLNIILLITDGHGHHTGDHDWGTEEFRGLRSRFDRLQLGRQGFAKFNNVMSPAVSTIMSIESMLGGIFAAKTHKMHWREWPAWDLLDHPLLSTFLQERGYEVAGFSYLLNAENWMPGIMCYRPELYRDFPSHKRDTHSHHAVLAAVKHYFAHAFRPGRPHLLMVHTIFLFDLWDELMALFTAHGFTGDNTIFAFTSDHYFPKNFGRQWLLGERDRSPIFHHTDLTEYNTRVFLYLKFPGLQPREIDDLVSGYDLTPTLLELIGRQGEWPGRCDGTSLLPLLEGRTLPERGLRSDNVYPYQIGEKQGRVTAVRWGRFKYVFRPDPASSYITYRMHEPWSRAIGHEEFYDVEADPEEQENLVGRSDPPVVAALERCRDRLRRTSDEIFDHHAQGLRKFGEEARLAETILPNRKPGRVLCFQSCPPEVCVTLVRMLSGLLPGSQVDLVAKNLGGYALPEGCQVLAYPPHAAYETEQVRALLGTRLAAGYDCLLRMSNVPVGDYAGVYDESAHPLGDFAAAGEVIQALPGAVKLSLGLDCSLAAIGRTKQGGAGGLGAAVYRATVVAPARWLFSKLRPRIRRWVQSLESGGPKMPREFSKRIIRKETDD